MLDKDEKWLEKLFSKRPGAIKPGLERIKCAYEKIGSPLEGVPSVLVAGTNGKGTTGGALSVLLTNLGLKVAHYTSPHITSFSERIRVSGENISLEEIKEEYDILSEKLGELFDPLSFFEIATLLAFSIFSQKKVDICVVEVGLGGRLDATNILNPDLSIVTSIDLDHTEWLGDSLEKIAYEKAGIARKGRPLLLGKGALKHQECRDYFESLASPRKYCYGGDFLATADGISAGSCGGLSYPEWLPNSSNYMKENYSLAYFAAMYLVENLFQDLKGKCLESASLNPPAFTPSSFKARGTRLNVGDKSFYIDIAHNPAAISESFLAFEQCSNIKKENRLVVLSLLADKDVSGILNLVNLNFSNIVLFKSKAERAVDLKKIEALISSEAKLVCFEELGDPLNLVKQFEEKFGCSIQEVYFGGSFAAVSEFFQNTKGGV